MGIENNTRQIRMNSKLVQMYIAEYNKEIHRKTSQKRQSIYQEHADIMKQLLTILTTIFCLCGCDSSIDEQWDAPMLDKSELHFAAEGGEQTVTILNYGRWWIYGGYEDSEVVDGVMKYTNYIYATHSDENINSHDLLDGGWYRAVVPNKGDSTQVIITVDTNPTTQPRKATIEMTVGNAGASIKIYQSEKN